MKNAVELAIEHELERRLSSLEQQIREIRAVQKTLITLGGTNNQSGLFKLLNASGTEVVRLDNGGVKVYGQAFELYNSLQELKGYLAYGIGGGNNVVLDATPAGGNIALVAAIGRMVKISADSLRIPTNTNNPSDDGETGPLYYNTSDNTLRVFSGGVWRKVTLA